MITNAYVASKAYQTIEELIDTDYILPASSTEKERRIERVLTILAAMLEIARKTRELEEANES